MVSLKELQALADPQVETAHAIGEADLVSPRKLREPVGHSQAQSPCVQPPAEFGGKPVGNLESLGDPRLAMAKHLGHLQRCHVALVDEVSNHPHLVHRR